MVFAFLCHSLASTPVRLLYSTVYGEDMQTALSEVSKKEWAYSKVKAILLFQNVPVESLREVRKEQLLQVR